MKFYKVKEVEAKGFDDNNIEFVGFDHTLNETESKLFQEALETAQSKADGESTYNVIMDALEIMESHGIHGEIPYSPYEGTFKF